MGTPVEQMPPPPATKTNVLTIVSLVGGILGLISMCIGIVPFLGYVCLGLGGLFAVIALITGFLGMSQANKNAEKGRGMAITGIILSVIALLGVCVIVIINVAAGPVIGNIFSQMTSGMMNSGLFVPTP